jgi:predicted nucleic acid-binding protein
VTPPRPTVYLDTNVFIAAFEHATARADHARWLLSAVEAGWIAGATSELTLAELLVKPLQVGASDLVEAYKDMIQSTAGFEVVTVDRDILIEAARVRAGRLSIRLPDAVHVATARHLGCDCLVTGDGRLSTQLDLQAIQLGPHTVDIVLGRLR